MTKVTIEQEEDVKIYNFDGIPTVEEIAAIEGIASVYVQLKNKLCDIERFYHDRQHVLTALKNPDGAQVAESRERFSCIVDSLEFEIARDATSKQIHEDLLWLKRHYGVDWVAIDEWIGE